MQTDEGRFKRRFRDRGVYETDGPGIKRRKYVDLRNETEEDFRDGQTEV